MGKTHGPVITEHVCFAPMSVHHETKLPSLLRANLRLVDATRPKIDRPPTEAAQKESRPKAIFRSQNKGAVKLRPRSLI